MPLVLPVPILETGKRQLVQVSYLLEMLNQLLMSFRHSVRISRNTGRASGTPKWFFDSGTRRVDDGMLSSEAFFALLVESLTVGCDPVNDSHIDVPTSIVIDRLYAN